MKRNSYIVIIENAGPNFSAYSPEVPGCIATGATVDETEANFREALALLFEVWRETGVPIPIPSAAVRLVKAA